MNIMRFAKKVISLAEYRKELAEYLHSKMDSVAPNLACLIGDIVRFPSIQALSYPPLRLSVSSLNIIF